MKNIKKCYVSIFFLIYVPLFFCSCSSSPGIFRNPAPGPVSLPFLRLEQAGECYFVDDFLPTPDSLVTGRTSGLSLRYYTYWNAKYKYWSEVGVMLSFYSKDSRCWGLFEEYVLPKRSQEVTTAG